MSQRIRSAMPRLFDASCALWGLLILFPVLAGLAMAILLDDGPPILFRQTRVGKKGMLFDIWKFRTMRKDSTGRAVTAAGDPRITRVGAWLRRVKLDELPQLFNVLKGDMSLIGPRPEVPAYVEPENPLWRTVLQSKPGITDLSTLFYRNEEEILGVAPDPDAYYRQIVLPAKLRLNAQYMRSRSFGSDLRLILLTIRYSLSPDSFNRSHAEEVLRFGV